MNQIGGGIIGNSNCIETSLNGLILNQSPIELQPIQFIQKFHINNNDRTAHFVGQYKFKELDIDYFYERKQTNEEMKTEMNEMNEIDVKHGKKDYSKYANVD